MIAGGNGPLWADALIREAGEHFHFLVKDHGFRQVNHIERWYANVQFQGERLTLCLTHGNREADFSAEIKYSQFPRKNPKALWLVFEALGLSRGPLAMETQVDEDRLRALVASTAELVARHWDLIDRNPSVELIREVERIGDRYARRVRKH
jgi:hypothetical protein